MELAAMSHRIWMMDSPEEALNRKSKTPFGPSLLQKQLEEDINSAIAEKSHEMLSLTLLRHHCCSGNHCLFEAVRREHPAAVQFLLQHGGEEVDAHCCGSRPLHTAVKVCSVAGDAGYQIAKMLLEHGASPNAVFGDDPTLEAPIQTAARRGSIAAAELLLSHGADPNACDATGCSPLHGVCRRAAFQIAGDILAEKLIVVMLKYGANPCQTDLFGHDAARYLCPDSAPLVDLLAKAKQHWYRRSLQLLAHGAAEGKRGGGAIGLGSSPPEVQEDILHFL